MASLQLRTLNCQRAKLLISSFLSHRSSPLPSPSRLSLSERVWLPFFTYLTGAHPLLGAPLSGGWLSKEDFTFYVHKVYSHEKYALIITPPSSLPLFGPRVRVLLHEGASPMDELKAFFQFCCLERGDWGSEKGRREAVLASYQRTSHEWADFVKKLKTQRESDPEDAWDLSRMLLGAKGWRLQGVGMEGSGSKKE